MGSWSSVWLSEVGALQTSALTHVPRTEMSRMSSLTQFDVHSSVRHPGQAGADSGRCVSTEIPSSCPGQVPRKASTWQAQAVRLGLGMDVACPSGTNKQLPTPPAPLQRQASDEGGRKRGKKISSLKSLFPELFSSVFLFFASLCFFSPHGMNQTWKRAVKTHPGFIVGLIFEHRFHS